VEPATGHARGCCQVRSALALLLRRHTNVVAVRVKVRSQVVQACLALESAQAGSYIGCCANPPREQRLVSLKRTNNFSGYNRDCASRPLPLGWWVGLFLPVTNSLRASINGGPGAKPWNVTRISARPPKVTIWRSVGSWWRIKTGSSAIWEGWVWTAQPRKTSHRRPSFGSGSMLENTILGSAV
jgi:hypothetical protein